MGAALGAGWGTGTPLMTLFGPSMDEASREAAARCERLSATPAALRALWRMAASIDVRDVLGKITAPTLVMHRVADRVIPVAAGRWLAAQLPEARYLELPGEDHFPFAGDPAPVVAAIAGLLGAAPPVADLTLLQNNLSGSRPPTQRSSGASQLIRLMTGALGDAPIELGRFRVMRSLGAGGMGAVYLALDRDLERLVAVKVLHRGDADTYLRFHREATAVAALSHPCVVAVHELGLEESVPYLVMEYVPGGTLGDLAAKQPLPWRRAVTLVAAAARGLGAAHALGIVHRDVKPANLLLPDPDGNLVKVADFGLAKRSGAAPLTQEHAFLGTLGYVAPEQARGGSVDARADVWALGATLFRLVTGRPHVEGSAAEIVARTLSAPIADPRTHACELPAAVSALVCRMGALDPEARLLDGGAVADALEATL
jgi:hypothetical protein